MDHPDADELCDGADNDCDGSDRTRFVELFFLRTSTGTSTPTGDRYGDFRYDVLRRLRAAERLRVRRG
jgi:hypothetical protein